MILQPSNVELTKVHYYEKDAPANAKTVSINTISREVQDNEKLDRNDIIKKNIFGHKWVLKINEDKDEFKKKSKIRLFVYVLVFFSIALVVGFGIFLTLEYTIFRITEKVNVYVPPEDIGFRNRPQPDSETEYAINNDPTEVTYDIIPLETTTLVPEKKPYCNNCNPNEICIKMNETSRPECIAAKDVYDPTGCGGLCQINTEFCKVLEQKYNVFQCSPRKTILDCDYDLFNCGNMCISNEKRCDGKIDCSNRADEENCDKKFIPWSSPDCNLTIHFYCTDPLACIPRTNKCDCMDFSDVNDCNTPAPCQATEFQCDDGNCIPSMQLCDGIQDCSDNSDEPSKCFPSFELDDVSYYE